MNKWIMWYVHVKSKHSFVRPTTKRSVSAPIKAFNTNERMTDRPPESVTWISCRNSKQNKLKWCITRRTDCLSYWFRAMLTWYWNRWSSVWFAPTRMSIIAMRNPKQTYKIDCTAMIWAMSNNGSHCVFRKPVFIFIAFMIGKNFSSRKWIATAEISQSKIAVCGTTTWSYFNKKNQTNCNQMK